MDKAQAHHMRLLAHDTLLGNGKMGEGMSIQLAAGGRRILWLARESAPKNFTGVDVTDPRRPKVVVQTDLPHEKMRSNSLEVVGDIMAVAYQVATPGLEPAGLELLDLSTPENPRRIAFFDCSGPHSRGVHQLWFVDGEYLTCAAGAADFTPRNQLDDQVFRMVDLRDPARPEEVGRWWFPGTREGDAEPPVARHPRFDTGWRAHNTNVYPARPDRAYLGYIDGGAIILDIADKARPKMVSHWNPHPPFNGFTHTVMPLFDRGLLVVTDESIYDRAEDWPKRVWLVDARDEQKLIPIATLPMPPVEAFGLKGGRYGAHNIHENRPGSVPTSMAASGSTTSRTRSSRRRSRATCHKRTGARRRVRRRSTTSTSTRTRSCTPSTATRRPVRARDGPLIPVARGVGRPRARGGDHTLDPSAQGSRRSPLSATYQS